MAVLNWLAPLAWPLALLGAALMFVGVVQGIAAAVRPARYPDPLEAGMAGFRRAMVGLALAGLGAGWALGQPWIAAIALGIGGEETLESSKILWALRHRPAGTHRSARARAHQLPSS